MTLKEIAVRASVDAHTKHDGDYVILMLEDTPENAEKMFMPYHRLRTTLPVTLEDYHPVYNGRLNDINCHSGQNIDYLLEHLFYVFNQRKPADYHGRSLSVSDIVAVNLNGKVSFWYCDNVGYWDLTDVLKVKKEEK